MTPSEARLTLYSRDYCHLCHDMLAALEALRGEAPAGFVVDVVDVDAHPDAALVERYDELVPVLVAVALEGDGSRELCHYFLDRPAVLDYLGEFARRRA